jgi:hypothetical protein
LLNGPADKGFQALPPRFDVTEDRGPHARIPEFLDVVGGAGDGLWLAT